jgi:hypothetical protein
MPVDSLCEDTCADTVDPILDKTTIEVTSSGAEIHQKTTIEQVSEVLPWTSTFQSMEHTLQEVTPIDDVVLVEDASDDEEVVISDTQVTEPILLITIEECSPHSTTEVSIEEPQLTKDPPIEAMSPPDGTPSREGEDFTRLPIQTMTTSRRHRKSYDRSSLRQSARLAQGRVLKDLGIVGNDGKFNEDAMQDYAERLKKVVPPDLLKPLLGLKGRAF